MYFFILAVVFSIMIGGVSAYNKLNELNIKGHAQMCGEKKTDNIMQEGPLEEKSLSGINNLRPEEPKVPSDQGGQEESDSETDSSKRTD